MHNRAEFDSRTDVVDDSGGEVWILFRVVNQQGDLGQADFFGGILERGLMLASPNSAVS